MIGVGEYLERIVFVPRPFQRLIEDGYAFVDWNDHILIAPDRKHRALDLSRSRHRVIIEAGYHCFEVWEEDGLAVIDA